MRSKYLAMTVSALAAVLSSAQGAPVPKPGTMTQPPGAYMNYASQLIFEANNGQTDPQVKFLSRGKGYKAYLTAGTMVLSLRPSQPAKGHQPIQSAGTQPASNTPLQFRLLGAAQNPAIVGEDPLPGRVNYFIGRDSAKWHTNVPTYSRIRYKNVYPGIDLIYYGSHQQLEYDFAISPGADSGQIQFEITGASQVDLDAEGNLVLQTNSGDLHFQSPTVYQESNAIRVPLSGAYVMNDPTHVSFHVAQYDHSKPLVIDPVLVYSTYLGGSGDDEPSGIAVDNEGSVYVEGSTDSIDFPLATLGSLPPGSTHVFVAKLDPTGSDLIYADYIGGNSQDFGYAIVLDKANEVYLTGSTASSDFPLVNPNQGTYPGSFNGFVTKVSADGSSLLYSTYLGGNGSDTPVGIALNSSGDILVAGNTSSTNFPVANAYQATVGANQGGIFGNYGFLTNFSADGSYLIYSTYFGGDSNVPYNCGGTPCWGSPFSAINGIVVDANGNAYLAGNTNTYNLPTTQTAYLTTNSTRQLNPAVGFVSKFNSSGSLEYSTYFYESSAFLTNINAIAVDNSGSAYVTGVALSDGSFPITSTSICDPAIYGFACDLAFVTKFDLTGSTLLYSTFLGPYNSAEPRAIALDASNDAYVVASTSSSSFNEVNGIEGYTNGSDLLLVQIDPAASTQLFATYFGASADEFATGIALDSNGNLYINGSTDSVDFPVTQGAFQSVLGGNTDAFILKIGLNSAPSVSLSPESLQYVAETVGVTSSPQTVLLRNMGSSLLTIVSIATSGDFAESDSCGTTVSAAGNCTLSVTFTPTDAGVRLGSIAIQDNAAGTPHVITLSGIGSGPLAVVSPQNLTFPPESLGTTSAVQAVTLTNIGDQTLDITAIQVAGDFAQVSNCPSTLAPNSSCIINVTFTPTASGIRAGTLTISDNAQAAPQVVNLTGAGPDPVAAVTPASLVFPTQPIKTSGTAHTVTLNNTGNAPLNVSAIQITGDFAQVGNCQSALPANSSCTINVTFTPTASGTRSGTITIADNSQGSPQVVDLGGVGSDFSITSSQSSGTVKAGATANYQLTVSAVGGVFGNIVKLSCSAVPALSGCSISPNGVIPNSGASTATLTISTTASVAQAGSSRSSRNSIYATWMQLQGIGMFGMIFVASKRGSKKFRAFIILSLIMCLAFMSACAGGTGITPVPQTGTTTGPYTITVTGTSGNLQHSLAVTLSVQ